MKIIKHVLIYNHVQRCLSLSSQSKELIAPQSMGAGWVFVHMKVESLVAKRPNDKKPTHSRTHSSNHCNSPQYLPRSKGSWFPWLEKNQHYWNKMWRSAFLLPLLREVLSAETQHITLTFQVKLTFQLTTMIEINMKKKYCVTFLHAFFCLMTMFI